MSTSRPSTRLDPPDPVAKALDMFARMPVIIGREPDSEEAAVFEVMAR